MKTDFSGSPFCIKMFDVQATLWMSRLTLQAVHTRMWRQYDDCPLKRRHCNGEAVVALRVETTVLSDTQYVQATTIHVTSLCVYVAALPEVVPHWVYSAALHLWLQLTFLPLDSFQFSSLLLINVSVFCMMMMSNFLFRNCSLLLLLFLTVTAAWNFRWTTAVLSDISLGETIPLKVTHIQNSPTIMIHHWPVSEWSLTARLMTDA